MNYNSGVQIKFLTLNIWHGGLLWDKLVKFIHEEDPDIAVFQEVYSGHDPELEKRFRTMEEFQKEFPELKYSAYGERMLDMAVNLTWGNAVFSKFEIKSYANNLLGNPLAKLDLTNLTAFQMVPPSMLQTTIVINGMEVSVNVLHGVWGEDGKDSDARWEMEKEIVAALKGKKPLILAGDTNLNPDTQFVKNIEEKLNIKNIFGNRLHSSFNMKHKTNPGFAKAVVDMIFVSSDIKVLQCYKPMADVSDHYPLIATLEI